MTRRFAFLRKSSSLFALGPRLLGVATLSLGLASCGKEAASPPKPIVLQTDTMTVTIGAPRFSVEIKNADGAVVLSSIDAGGNYTPLSAAHRSVDYTAHVLEGWDYQAATDGVPAVFGEVTHESHTSTTASIDLTDGSFGVESAHLDIAIVGNELSIDAKVAGPPIAPEGDHAPPGLNLVSMAFKLPADEHFFGLGERLITVDHRGQTYQSWVEEGGVGLGEGVPIGPNNPSPNGPSMSHAPVPFYMSNKGYGAWLDTSFRTGTSFGGERPDATRIWAFEPAMHLRVFVRADPKDALADFTEKTGRARLPAPWVFGPRRRIDRNAQVNGVPEIQLLRQKGVPCTAADDATHFLPIGSQVGHEAEIQQWTSDLHALGYKAIGYYNSYVSVTDPKAAADYAEGHAKGYFVKLDDGSEFNTFMISAGPQTVATIDMTNPDAVTWFGTLLGRSLDLGYDGFMLDFGEYIPPNAKMFDGRAGWEAHNAFPIDYQKATWDYMTEARGDDFLYFARSGYTGTQAYIPVHWSGDPDASFDDAKGLPSQIRAGINAGLSGIPFWGSDISGYTCLNNPPADKDVFLRWVEFGAFSSDMHEENACSGGVTQQKKWTLWSDAETTQVYGDYARLHTRLFPYLYAAAEEATLTGMPIMRHPVLMNPREADAYGVTLEYYFGPSLYVAPVARRAQTTRDLWLPPGRWVDWFTLEPLASGHITRDAPLDSLPLFLASGGVVAMLDPSIETLAPATDPSVVTRDKVAGLYDVRAAIDTAKATGSATLVDGTKLDVALAASGDVTLPTGYTTAPDDATLATCSACGRIDVLPTGVRRVRLTTAKEASGTVTAGALSLTHGGSTDTRIRWDVAVLP